MGIVHPLAGTRGASQVNIVIFTPPPPKSYIETRKAMAAGVTPRPAAPGRRANLRPPFPSRRRGAEPPGQRPGATRIPMRKEGTA